MKPPYFGLLFHNLKVFKMKVRIFIFKLRGLKIGEETALGNISCDWPNKLVIGSECDIQDGVDFRIWSPYENGGVVKLGDRVFIGHACEFVCNTNITIGNDCLIASSTTFVDTGHSFKKSETIKSQPCTTDEIFIGEDVWIGTSCVILKGVTIGRGSIIGAGSVVNKSIPEYEIWAGTPARFLSQRV